VEVHSRFAAAPPATVKMVTASSMKEEARRGLRRALNTTLNANKQAGPTYGVGWNTAIPAVTRLEPVPIKKTCCGLAM